MARFKPTFPQLQRGDPLASGLIAAYTFHEGAGNTLHDVSGNRHNGSLQNGPPWIGGRAGSCLSFNGSNQSVDTGIGNLPLTNLTISFWANESSGNGGRVFGYENASSGSSGIGLYFPSGPKLIMRNNGTSYDMTWGSVVAGKWFHYVITISSVVGTFLYLNSAVVNSNSGAQSYTSSGVTFHIGSAGAGGNNFKGLVDDVRIYSRALSAAEIRLLYVVS